MMRCARGHEIELRPVVGSRIPALVCWRCEIEGVEDEEPEMPKLFRITFYVNGWPTKWERFASDDVEAGAFALRAAKREWPTSQVVLSSVVPA